MTDQDALRTLIPLFTDRARSAFDLCDLSGLSLAGLAQLAESEPVQAALDNLRRIARVRHDFLSAEADLVATGALLALAGAPADTPKAADQSRKAAKDLRTKRPPPAPKDEPRASARAASQQPTAPQAQEAPSASEGMATVQRPPKTAMADSAGPRALPATSAPRTPDRVQSNCPRAPARPSAAQLRSNAGADRPP